MERLLYNNPFILFLISFLTTYFLIGTLRRKQYLKLLFNYNLSGAYAVKYGLLSLSAFLLLGLGTILYNTQNNPNYFSSLDLIVNLVLPIVIGSILYLISCLLDKKVKY